MKTDKKENLENCIVIEPSKEGNRFNYRNAMQNLGMIAAGTGGFYALTAEQCPFNFCDLIKTVIYGGLTVITGTHVVVPLIEAYKESKRTITINKKEKTIEENICSLIRRRDYESIEDVIVLDYDTLKKRDLGRLVIQVKPIGKESDLDSIMTGLQKNPYQLMEKILE